MGELGADGHRVTAAVTASDLIDDGGVVIAYREGNAVRACRGRQLGHRGAGQHQGRIAAGRLLAEADQGGTEVVGLANRVA